MLPPIPTYEMLDDYMSDASYDDDAHQMRNSPSLAVPEDYKFGWLRLAARGEERMTKVDELETRAEHVDYVQQLLEARDRSTIRSRGRLGFTRIEPLQ